MGAWGSRAYEIEELRDDGTMRKTLQTPIFFFLGKLRSHKTALLQKPQSILSFRKGGKGDDLVFSLKVDQRLLHSCRHCLLALTNPDSRIIVLLVWLVLYRGISGGLEKLEMTHTGPSGLPTCFKR